MGYAPFPPLPTDISAKPQVTATAAAEAVRLVEDRGFEPRTARLQTGCSPNCVNFNLKLLTFFNLKLRTFRELAPRLKRDLPWVFCPRCQTDAGSVATGDRLATRGDSEPIMTLGSGGCPRPDPGVRRAPDPGDVASGNCCRGC